MTRKAGRPGRPDRKRRTVHLVVDITPAERQAIKLEAALTRQPACDIIRAGLLVPLIDKYVAAGLMAAETKA